MSQDLNDQSSAMLDLVQQDVCSPIPFKFIGGSHYLD